MGLRTFFSKLMGSKEPLKSVSPEPVLFQIEVSETLWEGFWGIVIFGVEIENIGNELEIDSDLQVGY